MRVDGKKDKIEFFNATEIHSLPALVGQFNWLATQTRPDILFECCDLLGEIKCPTIDNAKRANKLVNQMKSEEIVATLKKEGNIADSCVM